MRLEIEPPPALRCQPSEEAMSALPTIRMPLIYLVDDEEMLLDLAEVVLGGRGYELKRFQNPQDAFDSFVREPEKPSLLLTDFAMGSMNGLELSAKCKAAFPQLKIFMVSGTAGPDIIGSASVKVDRFLPKPYLPSELVRTVQDLLAA